MLQITWYEKLKKLNPRLRVCQFESSYNLPGIYYIDGRGDIIDICATDCGWVPAYPEFNVSGRLTKSGYRRAIFILLHIKMTTRDKVRKYFGSGFFERRTPALSKVQGNSIHKQWSTMMAEERKRLNILGDAQQVDVQDKTMDKMKQMEMDNFNRRNSAALSGDQFIELAEGIKKDMPDSKKENLARVKFEYDKAVGKRKTII